ERGGVRGYSLSKIMNPLTPTLSPAGRGSPAVPVAWPCFQTSASRKILAGPVAGAQPTPRQDPVEQLPVDMRQHGLLEGAPDLRVFERTRLDAGARQQSAACEIAKCVGLAAIGDAERVVIALCRRAVRIVIGRRAADRRLEPLVGCPL